MLKVFGDIGGLVKVDQVWIDNNVFRLHYKATFIVFVVASLLVTLHQYIGDPIDCIVDGVPPGIMDIYCWIHSTFTIPSRWSARDTKVAPHPGVSPDADLEPGTEVKYHKYYQWVCFVLFLQAVMFYIPRYLWKTSEGGKIKMLVQGLQEPIMSKDAKKEQINNIVNYLNNNKENHSLYAIRYFFCEALNLVNVIGQIYFTDFFLDYEFSKYGSEVLSFSEMEPEDRPDPMTKVFPKVTKCTFFKYGPSGSVMKLDGLCVLPLNIINEKIYIFLWFWLVGLAAVTAAFMIYRIATLAGPQIRVALIVVKGGKSITRSDVEAIVNDHELSYLQKIGNWLVLHFVVKNLNPLVVNEIIVGLHKNLEGDNANTETLKKGSAPLAEEDEKMTSAV